MLCRFTNLCCCCLSVGVFEHTSDRVGGATYAMRYVMMDKRDDLELNRIGGSMGGSSCISHECCLSRVYLW